MIVAIAASKGGVGKTTSAVALASILASQGRRVLLVDADQQGDASSALGVSPDAVERGTADVLLAGVPAVDAIRTSGAVHVMPGSVGLADADVLLATMPDRHSRLRSALRPVQSQYDVILVDPPPSVGLVVVNCLVAADAFVLPCAPQPLALRGIVAMLATVDRTRAAFGRAPRLAGILMTMVDRRRSSDVQLLELVRQNYGSKVFDAEIPVSARAVEAPGYGRSVDVYASTSPAARGYRAAALELERRTARRAGAGA